MCSMLQCTHVLKWDVGGYLLQGSLRLTYKLCEPKMHVMGKVTINTYYSKEKYGHISSS